MAQSGFTPIKIYSSTTAAATPTAGNLEQGELAINTNDGKLFYEDSSGVVQVIATKAGASGDVVGPASATDNAIARYDGTTGKLIQNSGVTIDDSNNVGIGTASPTGKLDLFTSATSGSISNLTFSANNASSAKKDYVQFAPVIEFNTASSEAGGYVLKVLQQGAYKNSIVASGITNNSSNFLAFSTTNEAMRIDSSGNVGIGVTPSAWGGSYKALQLPSGSFTADGTAVLEMRQNNRWTGSANVYVNNGFATNYYQYLGAHAWFNAPSGTAGNAISFTQAMTLDASGNLLVGTTTLAPTTTAGTIIRANGVGQFTANSTQALDVTRIGTDGAMVAFFYGATNVGTITTNGTVTFYNTTSDYRLKENVAPMQNALATVAALKPCTYTWKSNGSDGQGFIAHELQEVMPDCVTGEKDAMRTEQYEISPAIPAIVGEDGEVIEAAVEAVMGEREVPQYQGIDVSFLVATLTAAIQEQQALIQELTTRLEALEA